MKVPGLFKNKYVLYALLFIGITNVLGYLALKDYDSLGLLMALGLLMGYFSKNMAVNIFVAVLVTSLIAVNKNISGRLIEGMTEGATGAGGGGKQPAKKPAKKAGGTVAKQLQNAAQPFACGKVNGKDTECPSGKTCTKQSQCVVKSGFQNNVPPSTPSTVNDGDESPGDRIDYAATMELAYDNLQKMLGEGGMKSITAETQKLVAQQKDLMGTLNSMAPVLDTAKETLKNINFDGMGDISKMLKQMGGSIPKDKK